MEFLIELLKIATTALTVILTQWVLFKTKKMDVEASKKKAIEECIGDCQLQHQNDITNVKAEFKEQLSDMASDIGDIKNESFRTSITMGNMQNEIKEVKAATEKIYDLQRAIAVIQNTIGLQNG